MSETAEFFVRCPDCNGRREVRRAPTCPDCEPVMIPCLTCRQGGHVSTGYIPAPEVRGVPVALLDQAADLIEAWWDFQRGGGDDAWERWYDLTQASPPEALVAALRTAAGHGNASLSS